MSDLAAAVRMIAAGAALAFAFPAPATAQTEATECGIGPAPAPAGVLFRLDGTGYSEADLSESMQQALYDAQIEQYERLLDVFDAAVLEIEVRRRAEAEGKTMQEAAEALFPIQPPDDAAVEDFFVKNAARIGRPLNEVRPQIRTLLARQALQEKRTAFIEETKRERGFEVALAAPVAPYVDLAVEGFPSKGDAGAAVTVVEFADYQCPHCRTASATLDRIVESHPGKVRVVYVDYPINASGISRLVAEGAVCADQQDAFWRYHDLAFERQDSLDPNSPAEIARALELDAEAFEACLASPAPRERVGSGVREGRRLGLRATPTLFLNGRRLRLHDLEGELVRAVDDALGASGKGG